MTGIYGVVGVLLALRAREATGAGQFVDLALYEPIFRMLDELAPAYQQFGFVRERMGADTVNVVPHSHYQCAGRPLDRHRLLPTTRCSPGSPRRWGGPSWPATTGGAARRRAWPPATR